MNCPGLEAGVEIEKCGFSQKISAKAASIDTGYLQLKVEAI